MVASRSSRGSRRGIQNRRYKPRKSMQVLNKAMSVCREAALPGSVEVGVLGALGICVAPHQARPLLPDAYNGSGRAVLDTEKVSKRLPCMGESC